MYFFLLNPTVHFSLLNQSNKQKIVRALEDSGVHKALLCFSLSALTRVYQTGTQSSSSSSSSGHGQPLEGAAAVALMREVREKASSGSGRPAAMDAMAQITLQLASSEDGAQGAGGAGGAGGAFGAFGAGNTCSAFRTRLQRADPAALVALSNLQRLMVAVPSMSTDVQRLLRNYSACEGESSDSGPSHHSQPHLQQQQQQQQQQEEEGQEKEKSPVSSLEQAGVHADASNVWALLDDLLEGSTQQQSTTQQQQRSCSDIAASNLLHGLVADLLDQVTIRPFTCHASTTYVQSACH